MIANKLLTHNSKPQHHQNHLFPKQKHPNLTPQQTKTKSIIIQILQHQVFSSHNRIKPFQVRIGYKNKTLLRWDYGDKSIIKKRDPSNFGKKKKNTNKMWKKQIINRKRDRRKPSWFGSNERERRFWGFPMRQKAGPVGTGDDRQRGSGGNARQWFWSWERDREQRWRVNFDFAKRERLKMC